MFPSDIIVYLSRSQFAFTAMFHFLFVPLTLGLTWILVIMEACYLITGKTVYRDMTKFWGKLLAINFAIGVISGMTLEFEFGMNWAYFARLIGGSFGPILAIEGITAFMLEATMFGLFYFSWDKVSKFTHFMITFLLALGASLSIVNILAANSWMEHPVATAFNYTDMSLDLTSIIKLYINSLAQVRIGHVAFAGFLTGGIFVMGISAYYLLKKQDIDFAKRSFAAGAGFALMCALSVGFFGDANGLQVAKYEPAQMAALESQWVTQKAPASWFAIAFPNQAQEKNYFVVKIPYALSLIATHSLSGTVTGGKELQEQIKTKIQNGIKSYAALMKIRKGDKSSQNLEDFKKYSKDVGYALLLKQYTQDVTKATPQQIAKAAKYGLPQFSVCFWGFRIMIGLWGIMLIMVALGFFYSYRGTLMNHPRYLRLMLYAIPLPYLAAETGWVTAEVGRQPWVIHGIMPTFLGTSSIDMTEIVTSLALFFIFYASLISIELFLMFKFARKGPSSLHLGKYHFETTTQAGEAK